jgi:PAS domain S-box-containing protein
LSSPRHYPSWHWDCGRTSETVDTCLKFRANAICDDLVVPDEQIRGRSRTSIGRPAVPPREHKLTQALESKLPPRHSASVGVRYAVAVLSVVAALSVTKVLRVYFEQTPNALFFCSVLLSSWFGGLGPGLLASLLSVDAIDYFFLFPRYTLAINPEDIPRLAVFLLSAFCISWVSERQRRAEKSLYQARDELEMKVYERTAELRRSNENLQGEIAERKEAELALRSSERRLKQAQAAARLGSYEVDALTGHTRWSDEVFRILGLDPASGSLSRQDFVERFVHPLDRKEVIERYDRVVREGKSYDSEFRVIRPDGSLRFLHSMGEPIKNEHGEVITLVGALLDITEGKHSEDNLARLNRTLQTLYQCNEASIHATEEYELLQAICRILVEVGGIRMAWVGYREFDTEKTIRPCAQAGYDDGYVESVKATWADTERGMGPMAIAIRTGKPAWTKDIRTDRSIAIWRSEALKRGYGSNISLPLISGGDPFGALTLYAEEPNAFNERTIEQFTELANNLAYGVMALRTREERRRAEDALDKAQAELAHVTRVTTLGEMTASIAHEINQPLAAVVNNAGACLRWLMAGPFPNLDEARHSLSLIIADGHRAAEIISRIRALVKKSPPQKDWLDINETILEVIALARSELQGSRVVLETELSKGLPSVLGDRIQLQQVILNLVMNGIEAMTPITDRGRDLLIRTCKCDSDNVLVEVKDSGIGLQSESIDQLFKTFFTTKPKGMGMGLAISRSIVDSHGGRLWATLNSGYGATFQFTLPIRPDSVSV